MCVNRCINKYAVRTFERKCQSKDDVGRHALLEQVSQALLAVRTSFVREICESDSDASAILASDLAATNTSPSPSTRTSTSLVAALVAAADESKSASRLVLQLAATSEQLLASVAEAMLQVPARNSDDRSLLAFTLLHSLVATSHSDSLDDASDDSLAERALLLALKNAKLDLPNEPFALATSRIVKTIACSTPTGLNDIVQFLFADLHSRSHSRLLSIFVSCAHSLGQAVLDLFKTRVETGINDLDRLSTLFGLSCLFLLDKWNIQAGGTKEFYHIWLARTLNSTTRRSIQFIASLFQSTYLSCPSDFNCATLLAVRNLPAFKQLVSDIKLHLADVSDLDQSKLVEVGIVDGKRLAFSRFMDEFTANGEKAVPKSLFMEILVNDAWYKTQFLPRLMKRVNETTDTQWKQQQTLFDFLRKAGRVPASFLATHAATLAENLQTGDKPISLTDLSDLKTRLETAIQLYAELDESVDEAFEQTAWKVSKRCLDRFTRYSKSRLSSRLLSAN
ncbi:hypothetical protein BCR33DRAFT_379906 [Rhizoclosmatium globosum]|uniref:Uncharacterized protein n=1 Tax=Rhizoclosmatium globosum TaxID=329046 RepID=A0A1Y2BYY3_9FUNG|nr:hypothetical protein BCR33DRAFT_379906 [Rhizoclosmatium globosum]|eukprot:ORY39979.1 hypothetical protein BCR33DRAFT_379906 [Rhizoclosmatium globosum]